MARDVGDEFSDHRTYGIAEWLWGGRLCGLPGAQLGLDGIEWEGLAAGDIDEGSAEDDAGEGAVELEAML